jgi:hypothetical protein
MELALSSRHQLNSNEGVLLREREREERQEVKNRIHNFTTLPCGPCQDINFLYDPSTIQACAKEHGSSMVGQTQSHQI